MTERPFRLQVLDAVVAQLKTITVAKGYQHDLADVTTGGITRKRVFRGRVQFGFNDPRPMVSVIEHPRALDQLLGTGESVSSTGDWDLLIQGFVEDDAENPTDPAHLLVADVVKALVKAKKVRGNILGFGDYKPCVTGLKVGSPVCRPPDGEISEVAFFFLPLTLTLVEDLENPFS